MTDAEKMPGPPVLLAQKPASSWMRDVVWDCLLALVGLVVLLAGAAVRQSGGAAELGLAMSLIGLAAGLAAGGYMFYLAWRVYLADRAERLAGYTTLNRGDRCSDRWWLDGVTGEVRRPPIQSGVR